MKHLTEISLFVFCLTTTALSLKNEYLEDLDHLEICRNKTYETSSPPNYLGPSLTTSFKNGSTDLFLCPGDAFGDLNETYIILQDCYLAIYHQGKQIWSFGGTKSDEVGLCAVALEKDGNLVLYKESVTCFYPVGSWPAIWPVWDAGMAYKPTKAELRIQDKQFQIVHTFKDGSERIFYTGQNIREFQEDLGAPKQIAKEFLIINHTKKDDVILRRNEYIGDLHGMHLILQTNCELQLNNNNQTIWSFAAYLKPDNGCTLSTQEGNSIGISKIPGSDDYFNGMKLFPSNDFTVLQSKVTFQEDRLFIIQTRNNGSEITFYSEPGQDVGLKLKREGKQIAKNKVTFSSETTLRRMDYIGDLNGLHLILQDDCVFKLANGEQELWKLKEEIIEGPLMECFVQFNPDGTIMFSSDKNDHQKGGGFQIFGKKSYEEGDLPSKFQLSLESNMMVLTLKYDKNTVNVYHAAETTMGTWIQYLSGHSLIVNGKDNKDKIFPEMGYIGYIHGVHAVLDKKGNWRLLHKREILWESGTTQKYESGFTLILTRNGNVALSDRWGTETGTFWSSQTSNFYKEAKLSQSELFVNDDGMWLNNIYVDGVVKRFRALEGTNSFVALSGDEDGFKRSSF